MNATTEKSWRDALPTEEPKLENADLGTDLDASLRFVDRNTRNLRYCNGVGWLAWDGTRWNPEGAEGQAIERSKESARAWTAAALSIIPATASDQSERSSRVKAACNLESSGHIAGAVGLATSDSNLSVHFDKLDADNWLLNVKNGTVDLRTGTLRAHHRADLITKLAQVDYKEGAAHPALEQLLSNLEKGAPGISAFLARCVGATLTGDASPETVFLVQGSGGNGKTTLLESIANLLGDYAYKLPFESICASRYGRSAGGATPDLVNLLGTRLAYASEGEEGARLDAGMIKLLSGNERVPVRPLYKDQMKIKQTWKLWMATNYDPATESDDSGLWRRMLKVPFPPLAVEHRDPKIKHALTMEFDARSALLNWAIKGCLDWQVRGGGRKGLAIPDCVSTATNAYREANNVTGQWFTDLLESEAVLDRNAFTSAKTLRDNYHTWCEDSSASELGVKRFAAFLIDKGLTTARRSSSRGWHGIRFLSPN